MDGPPPTAVVIGAGPGGLMAAEVLSSHGVEVTVIEHMPSVARKFLLAGRGGLNLTHSEPLDALLARYRWSPHPGGPSLTDAISSFPPSELLAWCEGLGHETFVGTSGRVFPRELRANALLSSWLKRLNEQGVEIRTRSRFLGWQDDALLVQSEGDGQYKLDPDVTVLALGGASWHRVGSDGLWQRLLGDRGVAVRPLTPSNCGFTLDWSHVFRERFEGAPVKNIAVQCAGIEGGEAPAGPAGGVGNVNAGSASGVGGVGNSTARRRSEVGGAGSARGEFMIVESGIEGGVVYALGAELRSQIASSGSAQLLVDLLPDIALPEVSQRLEQRKPKETTSKALTRLLGLDPVKIGLLNEVSIDTDGKPRLSSDATGLARLIKSLPIELTGTSGLERAISSDGGVQFSELDKRFMLKALPSVFCVGEMIDWDAPTGGYLLQATFSTAVRAAEGAIDWLVETRSDTH